ncbi:DUF6748 domain-containing protein [Pyxidicoccus xibeiensis]|uniref:DUF6748 domain-containing protein n=1 Tax=Pyxidicoccus xibeiensis TaxID=2906759 RepID=UPI0020A73554|nr:DUF6748 domain-containing protein [Pyxidicoccus xibeiensis]MCP3136755.1 hypothetical protein [Pyxidicoccus xibeiensis]
MNVRPLLLAALALGFAAGCSNNKPAPSSAPPPSEPGTAAAPGTQAPPPTAAAPQNEPGTAAPTPNPEAEVKTGESAVYIVKNSGIRCIAPPCPSYTAARVDKPGSDALMIHEVDLTALAGGSDERLQSLMQQTEMGEGLKVEATLDIQKNAGPAGDATVLRATRLVGK